MLKEWAGAKLKESRDAVREAHDDGVLDRDVDELHDSAKEVVEDHADDFDDELDELRRVLPRAQVRGRLKSIASVLEKLPRRADSYTEPEELGDVSGYAVVVPSLADVHAAADAIKDHWTVTETDDHSEKPKERGYRALHLTIEGIKDGLPKEVQIRTALQDEFAKWQHQFYKPRTDEQSWLLENREGEMEQIANEVADWYAALDHGESMPRPTLPPDVEEAFGTPWQSDEDAEGVKRWAAKLAGES
jgi:ppGpp synthetase/RelA/SpoT-type nucleotidyltranferase